MRITIDYTPAIMQGAGIGRYVRSLVEAMFAQDSSNHYTLFTCGHIPSRQMHSFPVADNVQGRSIIIPERPLKTLWYRWHLPLYANYFTGPTDIYHGMNFALPPLRGNMRKVVTVYDLTFLEHPETAVPSLIAYLQKVVPEAVASADVVITLSESTKQAIMEYYKVLAEKIVVVPCGVGPQFQRVTEVAQLEKTRCKFDLQQPFILSTGTLEPRKNHLGLIKAFHEMQHKHALPDLLVIAGGKGWMYEETQQMVTQLKLEDKVRFLGWVTESDLITLYSLANVFAYPTLSEGFGIPPLEAMACGVPVVTSNTSSLPEVVGEAALMVNPYDTHELAAAITRILDDTVLRAELCQRGYQQVQRYSWSQAAAKMLSVYNKLYQGITDFSEEAEVALQGY